jgi:predicted enzyme related to lactoylglutathione lyase
MKIKKILYRIYVNNLEEALEFYEKLFNEKCSMRFEYKEVGLELAQINTLLIIAGSDNELKPFRDTLMTLLVDSINEYRSLMVSSGATILRDIQRVPTGFNFTAKHKDGSIVEYVEHINI